MRLSVLSSCLLALALAGCHQPTAADKVGDYFEKKADAMDALADRQPTAQAKQIYHDRANALRDEGKEREKGLRAAHAGGEVPRMANVEATLNASEGNAQ